MHILSIAQKKVDLEHLNPALFTDFYNEKSSLLYFFLLAILHQIAPFFL